MRWILALLLVTVEAQDFASLLGMLGNAMNRPPPQASPAANPFAGFLSGFGASPPKQKHKTTPAPNAFEEILKLSQTLLNNGQSQKPFPPPPRMPPPPPPPQPTHRDYDDGIDNALTQINPYAVGRSVPQNYNPMYYRPNAKTFISNQVTGPPIRPVVNRPIRPHMVSYADGTAAPPPATVPPFTFGTIPPGAPTLAPPKLPKSDPKLLAHNTARMIREIATFSDSHHVSADSDYSAVESIMQAFFQAVSDGGSGGAASPQSDAPLQPLYDGTELGANRPLTNKLFESDMVLTIEQMKGVVLAANQLRNGKHRRQKRKVITGAVYRWPRKPIPYRFKGGDENWKKLIRSALRHWESETCVRWGENAPGKDHVIFIRGSGCYSSVGRTGGSQAISIGYGCEDKGIVTHEVGHSLGFWHEQSRFDRDKYIHLRKEYIIKGTAGNFERRTNQEIEDMGLPYDLGSVMHYGPTAFTKDWDYNTIETVDKKYSRTIGQRAQPSFIDVKQINRLYCHDICPAATSAKCHNGGYPNPNNCNKCKCPPGLGGPNCQQLPKSEANCGGELVATPIWQELAHRGKKKCYWRIKTNNARIKFILSNVTYRCETTCKAYVEIKHNSDFQQTGFRTCCDNEFTVTSEQAEVLVMTESSILDYETGFHLRYIQDSGAPLPKPPPPSWKPGQENRGFRGSTGGPVERFILQVIPKIRDANRPLESVASIVAEYSLASLLGISQR